MAPGLIDSNGLQATNFESNTPKSMTTTQKSLPVETFIDASELSLTLAKLSRYENPSLFVTPEHDIVLKNTPIPVPTASQVLIHVRCTGICGSDVHLWKRGAIGPLVVSCPSILGHEASGVVLAVGSAVENLRPGDKVAVEPGVPCHNCFLCAAGKYNLCESVAFAGVCPHSGTVRRFMTHEARYCHKTPDGMTFAQGALLEPLSVILHAVSQCKVPLAIGRPALICGAGPIGLIALAVARASGAWPLVITDVDKSRLEFAECFVPGVQTYRVRMSATPLECAKEIRQLYGYGPRDIKSGQPSINEYYAPQTVLECTGMEPSIATAAYCCRRGGSIMVVGVGRSTIDNLPFMHLSLAEIDLQFINRYRDTWQAGINALAKNQVLNLDALVTHVFPLERAIDAMELAAARSKGSVKVQIADDIEISI